MLDEMRINDVELTAADIGVLENAKEVAELFRKLHYNVDVRSRLQTTDLAYLTNNIRIEITHHELLATDDEDGIKVYLFEVRSVTAALRNALASGFATTNDAKVMLILTKDYEELEFTLLDRQRIETKRKGISTKVVARPIPLNINRRNPEPVKLRVLKRFTLTEEDSDYQWDKLRSAYTLAAWSEEHFNNRALFSDYYLKQRLTDTRMMPEWDEDVRPTGREVYRHLITARRNFSGQPEAAIRSGLYEPLFTLLGFDSEVNKASESAAEEPDYWLYSKGDRSKPVAAALTYVWNRNLDDVDTSREPEDGTPDEIPGAMVVSVLEKTQVPWVIVTNGKLWRLYSSTASNKATNYYEVDLEEAATAPQNDQVTAMKYWWLMFRQQAFTGFLDKLLSESDKYAAQLRERLKDDVFLRIFPQFAKGFITHMREQNPALSSQTLSVGWKDGEIDLDLVFSGTMTFLYRMMFILYAESLDLLPVNEKNGYGEYSLFALKQALADVGGVAEADSADKLRQHFTTDSTAIYDRLKMLFSVIDKGSEALNMPTYNGGLFSTETSIGQFLEQYAIPDQFLMLGLDRLTRDEDDKTKKLVFIDFKSLGVRQLGSIYEGLLEFRLKIAAEPLAVERDGKREVYVPLNKAKRKDATAAVAKDEVYLENDKQERKATGSYYTPDYIVKYIVQHTVGPVLERKLNDCAPRLRQAQADYRKARAFALQKGEDPEKFWALHEPTSPMSQLVDECLNVRVLDPAMGSGHFLVEVVDFVSNKLITFLNGWSENPVWAHLDRIRTDILSDMERQHVTVDADKLTRVALLKRSVLKRCVYGVDLNEMAVELAKVSLWLDAFTLGAPLSFLDHHLKWGNSLIGAMDLSDVVAVGSKRWEMILEAAANMVELSRRTDSTIGQVDETKADYQAAVTKLEDVKKYANVSVAAYFVDKLNEYRTSKKNNNLVPQIAQIAYGIKQNDGLTNLFALAQAAGTEKHFFHWKLEFPEVFIDLQKRAWAKDGGFDVVVGNPPYVNAIELNKILSKFEKPYWKQVYKSASGAYDLYVLFIEASLYLVTPNGYSGLITPNKYLSAPYGEELRRYLYENHTLVEFYNLSRSNPFDDPSVYPVISIIRRNKALPSYSIKILEPSKTTTNQYEYESAELAIFPEMLWGFLLLKPQEHIVLKRMIEDSQILDITGEVVASSTTNEAEKYEKYIVQQSNTKKDGQKIIDTGTIDRYESLWPLVADEPFLIFDSKAVPDRRQSQYAQPKLIFAKLALRIEAVCDLQGEYASRNTNFAFPKDNNLLYLAAICNSWPFTWIYRGYFGALIMGGGYTQYQAPQLRLLPVKTINFTTPVDERERAVNTITSAYASGTYNIVLMRVKASLALNQPDVVHDVLAYLAGQMIDLNKQKQAEVKRFLGWLEGRLSIVPKADGSTGMDSLTGKTDLQNYLGDYQKGKPEITWKDFFYRLHQNRVRFGVAPANVEAEIEREYAASLAVLLPIKDQLAQTDALIDKIVYQLYGLTAEEIELIERPQYEQALADAKQKVREDETLQTDRDAAFDYISESIEPAVTRLNELAPSEAAESALAAALPTWQQLSARVQKMLLQAERDYMDENRVDYTGSQINYAKAIEVTLKERLFDPFRARFTEADVSNEKAFKPYMRGSHKLTLGNFPFLFSSKEKAFRVFIATLYPDADTRIFGAGGVASALTSEKIAARNGGAHEEVISREEAGQARTWAFGILGMV